MKKPCESEAEAQSKVLYNWRGAEGHERENTKGSHQGTEQSVLIETIYRRWFILYMSFRVAYVNKSQHMQMNS